MNTPVPIAFTETAEHEKGFATYFKDKIEPVLAEVEANRLVKYASYKRRMSIAIVLSIAAFIGSLIAEANMHGEGELVKISIGFIIAIFAWAYLPARRYMDDVKCKFLPVVCQFFGNMTYAMNGTSSIESKYAGEIFPSFTSQNNEDFIQGEYKGVALSLHETKLKRKSGKKRVVVFRGLVLELDFKKNFTGKTLLLKDAGTMGNFFTGSSFNNLQLVQLEDPEFESIFQVFSSDQVEARYVLTTAFMQRLLDLARLRSSDKYPKVQCVFEANKLIISIPSSLNLFEPAGLNKSAFQLDDIHSFLAQMKDVFNLVDVLKLK